MTIEQLMKLYPAAGRSRCEQFLLPLASAMSEFGIDTPARQQAFLAQIGHESGQLRYTREIWGPTPAQKGYEGRKDLGNTWPGDGERFKGRGLIQITGRTNYTTCSQALHLPLTDKPQLLEEPVNACRSAAWWWSAHGLNTLADQGDMKAITKRINGGFNGLDERLALYERAQQVMA